MNAAPLMARAQADNAHPHSPAASWLPWIKSIARALLEMSRTLLLAEHNNETAHLRPSRAGIGDLGMVGSASMGKQGRRAGSWSDSNGRIQSYKLRTLETGEEGGLGQRSADATSPGPGGLLELDGRRAELAVCKQRRLTAHKPSLSIAMHNCSPSFAVPLLHACTISLLHSFAATACWPALWLTVRCQRSSSSRTPHFLMSPGSAEVLHSHRHHTRLLVHYTSIPPPRSFLNVQRTSNTSELHQSVCLTLPPHRDLFSSDHHHPSWPSALPSSRRDSN